MSDCDVQKMDDVIEGGMQNYNEMVERIEKLEQLMYDFYRGKTDEKPIFDHVRKALKNI